ncbi:MAG: YkgJ family cysteine cluster protein [Pseudobdellovibrionaceae bacterium]
MDLILDPKKIEALGNLKWDENQRFRHWLKSKDSQTVAHAFDQLSRQVSAKIDCTECAICCKSLAIVPKSTDIKRLSDGLQISPYEFKTKYLKKDFEGDLVFKQRPCPFLKANKCSVYEHRPETCRSYPHMENSHMIGRGWHIVENTRVCPIVYNTYEAAKNHFGFALPPTKERTPNSEA